MTLSTVINSIKTLLVTSGIYTIVDSNSLDSTARKATDYFAYIEDGETVYEPAVNSRPCKGTAKIFIYVLKAEKERSITHQEYVETKADSLLGILFSQDLGFNISINKSSSDSLVIGEITCLCKIFEIDIELRMD